MESSFCARTNFPLVIYQSYRHTHKESEHKVSCFYTSILTYLYRKKRARVFRDWKKKEKCAGAWKQNIFALYMVFMCVCDDGKF